MKGVFLVGLVCGCLTGCGLTETASSVAAGSSMEAQQAQQAAKTEARVQQQLDAAAALEAQRRQEAEANAQ